MIKGYQFTVMLMNGTVTMQQETQVFTSRELAERTKDAIIKANRNNDLDGMVLRFTDIREFDIFEKASEIEVLQERKLKLRSVTPMGGDCTQGYVVDGAEGMTVREFIAYIFEKNPNEWGKFCVNDSWRCEYKNGNLDGKAVLEKNTGYVMGLTIREVKAAGGWSRMDYGIYTN